MPGCSLGEYTWQPSCRVYDGRRIAMTNGDQTTNSDAIIETIRAELAGADQNRKRRILEAIALAALGSIPWVGGVLAAAATFKFDEADVRHDALRNQWLEEH